MKNPTAENLAEATEAGVESASAQTGANLANAKARSDSEAYGN